MRRLVLPQFGGSGLVRLLAKGHRRANTVALTLREWRRAPAISVAGVPVNVDALERRRVDVRGVADLAHEYLSRRFASYALSGSVKQMRDAGLVAFTLASSRHSHCVP